MTTKVTVLTMVSKVNTATMETGISKGMIVAEETNVTIEIKVTTVTNVNMGTIVRKTIMGAKLTKVVEVSMVTLG
jgi:hypothetical protein